MEEKKTKAASEAKEPTYEDLKNYCNQLYMQRNQVAERLDQLTDVLNILPYLFKVIENKDSFNTEFVVRCTEEIERIMTPQPESTEKEEQSENKE